MLVCFNGTWLTNDGSGDFSERAITSVIGARLNGKQLVEDAQFLRAISALPIARGNESHAFAFKVTRNLQLLMPEANNPIAQAAAFMLTHFTNLPKSGSLLIVCGGPGEETISVSSANAVLESTPECSFAGVSVEISYSLRCDLLTMIDPASNATIDCGTYLTNYTFPADGNIDGGVYTDPDAGRLVADLGAY